MSEKPDSETESNRFNRRKFVQTAIASTTGGIGLVGTAQASDESEKVDTQQSSEALINGGLPSDPQGYVPTIDGGESYEFFSSNIVQVFDDEL